MSATRHGWGLQFDASALLESVQGLQRLQATDLVRLQVNTLNQTAQSVRDAAPQEIAKAVNLDQAYIASKMAVHPADANHPTARVTADPSLTLLSHYDPAQVAKPVTWSNARIQGMGHKFGKWPGWTYRKGDAKRAIAPDSKAAGITVTVRRGQAKTMPGAFTVTLRNGNGVGIFTRGSDGKPHHRYGPSVYQLYSQYLETHEPRIAQHLQDEFMAGLTPLIEALT